MSLKKYLLKNLFSDISDDPSKIRDLYNIPGDP